jgi:hypothetical protein
LLDSRLRVKTLDPVIIAEEEAMPEEAEEDAPVEGGDHGMQLDVESPDTVVAVDMS